MEDVVNEDQCVLAVLSSDSTMLKIQSDEAIVIETGDKHTIYSVAFKSDGTELFSGKKDGLRRWQVADGQEVGNRMGKDVIAAISVSRNGKWIVCGTSRGASVWDAKTQGKSIGVEGTVYVRAVDISPESTRFATATGIDDNKASIWNIITGESITKIVEM